MGADEKAKAAAERAKGKAKEAAGRMKGDEEMEAEGRWEQTKGDARHVKEETKDAAKRHR